MLKKSVCTKFKVASIYFFDSNFRSILIVGLDFLDILYSEAFCLLLMLNSFISFLEKKHPTKLLLLKILMYINKILSGYCWHFLFLNNIWQVNVYLTKITSWFKRIRRSCASRCCGMIVATHFVRIDTKATFNIFYRLDRALFVVLELSLFEMSLPDENFQVFHSLLGCSKQATNLKQVTSQSND